MPFSGDPLGYYGQHVIKDRDARLLRQVGLALEDEEKHPLDITNDDPIPLPRKKHPLDITNDNLIPLPREKVGILGAGIGGLYAALMLDSIGIDYEILEASDRVGGRLETHKFVGGGKYDYYDAGAMRYPLPKKVNDKYQNGIMARLADLIDYPKLNEGSDKLKDKLITYYYKARRELASDKPAFYFFNGIHRSIDPPKGDPVDTSGFKAAEMGVGAAYIKAGYDSIQADVLNPFVRGLINDLETGSRDGWDVMLENDAYSVRGYMATKYLPSDSLKLPPRHLPLSVINWCNLIKTASGRYDRALTEAVLSEMEFANIGNTNFAAVDWKCFEGGSETLSKKIAQYLESKNSRYLRRKHRVTAIEQITREYSIPGDWHGKKLPPDAKFSEPDKDGLITVHINNSSDVKIRIRCPGVNVTTTNAGKTHLHEYDHVISTLPLPVLRTIDLTKAGLKTLQQNALRALDYGFSVKIALRFQTNWWTTKLGIFGGQSFTDLPIRTIVYPSYGTPENPSKVLIASYSWSSDASRVSALATKEDRSALKELVLRNLELAHKGVNGCNEITYDFLSRDLAKDGENFHVKDWNTDEYTMGTFAYFSPGQFGDLYSALTYPAANECLHFAGEAISTRHRWVVGALDSAWRSVHAYLRTTRQNKKLEEFKKIWKGNTEWITKSTLLKEKTDHDLLDEHIALLRKLAQSGLL